jgi:hypothetical protein
MQFTDPFFVVLWLLDDAEFVDFCTQMLQYDQTKRPSALEALRHPFVCDALEADPAGAQDTAELFEQELRAAHGGKVDGDGGAGYGAGGGSATPKGKAGGGSATGRFADRVLGKKDPPQRLKSTKGKVVAKPEKPRANNATKKTRAKQGAAI